MALDTNLSGNPYFDDYTPETNFHRVLFRPATAVQTRELNELQSIMQDQIDKFGRHVFKEGSVIEGCAFSFDRAYDYVKLTDTYSNGTVITASDLEGKIIRNSNGLEALVINSISGLQSLAPDLNTIYLKYKNSAVYANGTYQKTFDPTETLSVYTTANVLISSVTVASNTADANVGAPIGSGYGFTTTEGTIFSKGFFVRVEPQTLVVEKYSQNPNNVSIGFYVQENIITPEANTNLLDNAAGAKNYTAPGAHRLKLIPNLVKRTTNDTSNTVSFFSLVDFKDGYPVSIKRDPQYAALSKELARRTYEESGDYVINPFIITTHLKGTSDPEFNTHLNVVSTTGLAYVKGHRVEFVNKNYESIRRGTDTIEIADQQISTTFGQYVEINEFIGEFNVDEVQQVELHNVAKTGLTSATFLSTARSAIDKIGTAYIKGLKFVSGTPGTPDGKYYLYLFNIEMDAGRSFKDVKSVISYDGSLKGVADVVLSYDPSTDTNIAKIQDTKKPTLIYSLGRKSVSTTGFSNISYTYRNKSTGQINALSGSVTITIPSVVGTGDESFPYSGELSSSQRESFIVVPTSNGYSENKTGTVSYSTSSNTITGSSSRFIDQYKIGDYIYLNNSVLKRIDFISNNTSMRVDSVIGATASGVTHKKAFIAGCPIPLSTSERRSITANSTSATIGLGEVANANFDVTVYHPIYRSSTVPIKKTINKHRYVKIDCSNNAAGSNGPWCLGLPDVFKINAIYVGTEGSYSNTGTDYSTSFILDNGQRDNYYGLAKISVKPDAGVRVNNNTTLLVDVDHFTYDQSQGVGFFNANSYPIDDANTANNSAITTLEIPLFKSSIGTYDLRNVIDFRTFAQNTAVSNTTVTNATINPSSTLTISTLASGSYLPEPDATMYSDVNYYLPRIDKVALSTDGYIKVIEGVSSLTPIAPEDNNEMMTIATVTIPAYPSLPSDQITNNRYDFATSVKISQQRRWRMKDISGIDNRIKRLEYYTALSLLEKSAQDLLVRSDATGQNRFKNGILVDPFNDHMIGNTLHPQYRIAIDPLRSEIRPYFAMFRNEFQFDENQSTGCAVYGKLLLLENEIESTPFISQKYATKYRNVREGNIRTYNATMEIYPDVDLDPDITKSPDIINTYDSSGPWKQLDAAWGTQWGSWETLSNTLTSKIVAEEHTDHSLISSETAADGTVTDTYLDESMYMTEYTNNLQQVRTGTDLIVGEGATQQYDLGTFVTDVTILPYIKSNFITFRAQGLRPNTKFYAFFDDVPVTAFCSGVTDQDRLDWILSDAPRTSVFSSTIRSDIEMAHSAIGCFGDTGTDLISDSTGTLWGKFKIPEGTFRSLQLELKVYDIEDPTTEMETLTSQASATYYANRLGYNRQTSVLNIREPSISSVEIQEQQVLEFKSYDTAFSSSLSRTVTPPPPPEPQPTGGGDSCGCGSIICTELYRLGLMDRDTYLADEAFGAHLRNVDPDVYYGYLKWANHVVSWMRGDNPNVMFWIRDEKKRREIETNLTIKITHRIATPWAEHMQYLMGGREKDNLVGKVIMGIGRPISKLLNKLPKFGKEKASKPVSYLMIGLFMMLYYMSKVFGDKVGFPKEINKA